MADEAPRESPPGATPGPAICPWCSAALPVPDASVCPACQAHLIEEQGVEIPGVTTVYPGLLASAAAPRKVKRTFGSLLVGEDNEIPPPTEAELPALAPPDADVRREMLRLELDARLASLQAEVKAIEAEDGIIPGVAEEPPSGAPPDPASGAPGAE
ncbi:MAG: hypothetical protein MUE92_07545 [Chloroflexi bacterium]|nr:hypothetical protein [Chloroflexota bacterium]